MNPTRNPWKKLKSLEVFRNPWFSVRQDQVVCPDGTDGTYTVIETRIATGVVALTENFEVYLVGQFRYPVDEYSWEIPEGGSEIGEDPLETAKRELQEEAGLIASSWEQLGGVVHLSNCISSETGYLYLARGLTEVNSSPDHTEILQVKKVPLRECLKMIDRGEIKDSLTIIALSKISRDLRISQ